jgi:hypothetical protein
MSERKLRFAVKKADWSYPKVYSGRMIEYGALDTEL